MAAKTQAFAGNVLNVDDVLFELLNAFRRIAKLPELKRRRALSTLELPGVFALCLQCHLAPQGTRETRRPRWQADLQAYYRDERAELPYYVMRVHHAFMTNDKTVCDLDAEDVKDQLFSSSKAMQGPVPDYSLDNHPNRLRREGHTQKSARST